MDEAKTNQNDSIQLDNEDFNQNMTFAFESYYMWIYGQTKLIADFPNFFSESILKVKIVSVTKCKNTKYRQSSTYC